MTSAIVTDREGVEGHLRAFGSGAPRRAVVALSGGVNVLVPADSLEPRGEGRFRTTAAFRELAREQAGSVTVPVLEEKLHTGTRTVTKGFRAKKSVRTEQKRVELPAREQRVQVRHVPVGRFVDGPQPVRQEGDTTIVPLLEEVVVVEKRWMLREEVHITRSQEERLHSDEVALRHEDLTIEPIKGE